MTLVEALRAVGVTANEQGRVETPRSPSYNESLRLEPGEDRPVIYARYEEKVFLVVPLTIYVEGEIAEEWCVSAGSPSTTPRTILLLRDGNWVFLGRDRDPSSKKWPTIPFDGVFHSA